MTTTQNAQGETIHYRLRRFPTDAPRDFTDVEAAAHYWIEECPGMPLRVTYGIGGEETYGLHSEVSPLLDACARIRAAAPATTPNGFGQSLGRFNK